MLVPSIWYRSLWTINSKMPQTIFMEKFLSQNEWESNTKNNTKKKKKSKLYRCDWDGSGQWRRRLGDGPPPGDGREGDETGTDPDESDEVAGPFGWHTTRVGEWVGDGPVSVHGNDAQVQDGRRRRQHVERVPCIAYVLTFKSKTFQIVYYIIYLLCYLFIIII